MADLIERKKVIGMLSEMEEQSGDRIFRILIARIAAMPAAGAEKRRTDAAKRRWEAHFQKWADKNSADCSTKLGHCPNGKICDFCDSDLDRDDPCVLAFRKMVKEMKVRVDYEVLAYEDAWNGELQKATNEEKKGTK